MPNSIGKVLVSAVVLLLAQACFCQSNALAQLANEVHFAHDDQLACDSLADEVSLEPGLSFGKFCVMPTYFGEVFTNARGGLATKDATQYLGLLNLAFEWDLAENPLGVPSKLHVLAQNTHGRGLTTDFVGDTQVVSNIDSFQNIAQVSEYWLETELFNDRVTLRLGKQDINQEFLVINAAEDFIQSTFGLSPSSAFPTYPDPAMGAVVLVQLNDAWQFKAGLWNAFARGNSWGFAGDDTVLVVGELEKTYSLGNANLPGVFAIGAVYESAGEIDGERISPVHEYIVQLEQCIYREPGGGTATEQGASIFAGYYPRFPGERIIAESIGSSFVAGGVYRGLLPGRDQDTAGIGLAWTELFQGGTNREAAWETFYRMRFSPRLAIQSDLQYIASPSGIYRDALVVGTRFQIDF